MKLKSVPGIEVPPDEGDVRLPNGYTLYWKMDEAVGCREYYSDEVGGGVGVWNTALVDDTTLLAAIVKEAEFRKREYVIWSRMTEEEREAAISAINILEDDPL